MYRLALLKRLKWQLKINVIMYLWRNASIFEILTNSVENYACKTCRAAGSSRSVNVGQVRGTQIWWIILQDFIKILGKNFLQSLSKIDWGNKGRRVAVMVLPWMDLCSLIGLIGLWTLKRSPIQIWRTKTLNLSTDF